MVYGRQDRWRERWNRNDDFDRSFRRSRTMFTVVFALMFTLMVIMLGVGGLLAWDCWSGGDTNRMSCWMISDRVELGIRDR